MSRLRTKAGGEPPQVALLIETPNAYARALLGGIGGYLLIALHPRALLHRDRRALRAAALPP